MFILPPKYKHHLTPCNYGVNLKFTEQKNCLLWGMQTKGDIPC